VLPLDRCLFWTTLLHKNDRLRELCEEHGKVLPPYSPDYNPISYDRRNYLHVALDFEKFKFYILLLARIAQIMLEGISRTRDMLLLLILNAFGAAWAHVADLSSIYMWYWRKPADFPPQDKNPHSIYYMRSKISHKVGCKCFRCRTSIGCLLASTATSIPLSLQLLVSIQIEYHSQSST
jgi:hypothetical protein